MGQKIQPRCDRTNMVVSSCSNSGSVLSSLSSTRVSPLAATLGRRGWTGAFESKGSDHLFHMARVGELHRTVLLWIWSCLSRSAVTSSPWTEAMIFRLFGVHAHARLSPAHANLLQESSKLAFPVLSSVTDAVQTLSQQPTRPTRLRIEVCSLHVNHQERSPFLVA